MSISLKMRKEIEILDACNKAVTEERIKIQHDLNIVLEYVSVMLDCDDDNDETFKEIIDAVDKLSKWAEGKEVYN